MIDYIFNSIPMNILLGILFIVGLVYIYDRNQKQHSVTRSHPIIGRIRYFLEQLGVFLRQYIISGDTEQKPIDRETTEIIAKASKYLSTIIGFGSKKDFSKPSLYLSNNLFALNKEELKVDNSFKIQTKKYHIIKEPMFGMRKEKIVNHSANPWLLSEDNAIVIGPKSPKPFILRGTVGISAISYGAASANAISALAQGVAISTGSWMNTGEGSISKYHRPTIYKFNNIKKESHYQNNQLYQFFANKKVCSLEEIHSKFGNNIGSMITNFLEEKIITEHKTDLIFQIGSGLYGARQKNLTEPKFCAETFKKNASIEEVKAIEIKLAQGAKLKGGHVDGSKVTNEIAEIRGVEPWKTIDSPNRFSEFHDVESLFDFIDLLKELAGKPVGIKIVIGNNDSLTLLAKKMKETGRGPDFITVDGGEGGSGATYYEMATSLGLPIFTAIAIVNKTLKKYKVRNNVVVIASGMLATPDKMAMAMALGADLINVARAAMNTVGCINTFNCHKGNCPTGVTSHDPHKQRALVVEEKRFRTANYLITMREGMFLLAGACGVNSPTKLNRQHLCFQPNPTNAISLSNVSFESQ